MHMGKINMWTSMRHWLSRLREPQVNMKSPGGSRMGKAPDTRRELCIGAISERTASAVNGKVREQPMYFPAKVAYF